MAAPNLKEIEWAISELEQEESSKHSYILLAALYTCRNEIQGIQAPQPRMAAYSEATGPVDEPLDQYGGSEFLQAIAGKNPASVWGVMNEHMNVLRVLQPKAYDGVMRRLRGI